MANGYKVRIGEPTKSADGKRLMPFVMIFRGEQAQESIHDLKPCMSDSSISRQAALDAIDEIESEVADGDGFQYEKWRQFFCDLPSVDIDLSDYSDRLWRNAYEQGKADAEVERKTWRWNDHEVACIIADLMGDACACNVNGIDEWLPRFCEFANNECPYPVDVACWEQYLKWRGENDAETD